MAMNATTLATAIKTRLTNELHYDLTKGEAGKFVDIITTEIVSHIKNNAATSATITKTDITTYPTPPLPTVTVNGTVE